MELAEDDYCYDSGNEEGEQTFEPPNYVPHHLVIGRKHIILIDLVNGVVTLVPYNVTSLLCTKLLVYIM